MALTYSNIVFGGVILIWLFNTLGNVIRGTGNTHVPAVVTLAGAALLVPLSAALISDLALYRRSALPVVRSVCWPITAWARWPSSTICGPAAAW